MPASQYDPNDLLYGSIAFRGLANGTARDSRSILATGLLQLAIVSARLACSLPESDAQPSFDEYLNIRRELVQDGLQPLEGAFAVAFNSDEPFAQPLDQALTQSLVSLLEAPMLRALLPALVADKSLLSKLGQHLVGTPTASATTLEGGNPPLIDALVPLLVPALVDLLVEPLQERLQSIAGAQHANPATQGQLTPQAVPGTARRKPLTIWSLPPQNTVNRPPSILPAGGLLASPKATRTFGGLGSKGKENEFGLIRASMTSPMKNPAPPKKARIRSKSEAGSEAGSETERE
ncbi:hypothetical protein LXA43DRAFT_1069866 [Ganoderma leucocontextum]|nr:hypothetical protein LXA43DRAFT_1069866 [Ganoderma leucocontextum]